MKTSKTLLAAAACALAALALPAAHAGGTVIFAENFDTPASLDTWLLTNNSGPPGQRWFQGNAGIFEAQAGAADSYVAANYLSAAQGAGRIDNWLITPELTLTGATHLSFYTRSEAIPGFNDMLEVRFSSDIGSGGFSTLLATVGGPAAYPGSWQQFGADVTLTGTGRFAFRYLGDAATSNYIGIDTVTVSAVPEPSAWIMLGLGLAALPLLRRRART